MEILKNVFYFQFWFSLAVISDFQLSRFLLLTKPSMISKTEKTELQISVGYGRILYLVVASQCLKTMASVLGNNTLCH